jgi:ectoine hydroxylase-related dioxygenase (phytanoyl-CoA dioxygenase family)
MSAAAKNAPGPEAPILSGDDIADFRADGAVHLPGLFTEWVHLLRDGVAYNEEHPSRFGGNSLRPEESGRFFDDYCNWRRIPEYRAFVENSCAAAVAGEATGATFVRIFHEHVLIKEPGTSKRTPWHHDLPYYNVQGRKTASLWLALDPVPLESSLEFAAGSHRWNRLFYPRRFLDSANYDYPGEGYEPVPDIDADRTSYRILRWALEPGDAVMFDFRTLHAAAGNSQTTRRRGFSTRWVGDDVRYAVRPGETSPPYHDIGLADGDKLPDDLFPIVWFDPDYRPPSA